VAAVLGTNCLVAAVADRRATRRKKCLLRVNWTDILRIRIHINAYILNPEEGLEAVATKFGDCFCLVMIWMSERNSLKSSLGGKKKKSGNAWCQDLCAVIWPRFVDEQP